MNFHDETNVTPPNVVDQEPIALGSTWDSGDVQVPGGLELIKNASNVLIRQQVRWKDCLAGCSGFEVEKKYTVHRENGDTILWATEKSDCCSRLCCGSIRELEIKLTDFKSQEILSIYRPLNCTSCCCSCCYPKCTQAMTVSMDGGEIGTIRERATWVYPVFHAFDSSDQKVMKIRGPCCTTSCGDDIEFFVTDNEGKEIGSIEKKFTGCCREILEADTFKVEFKADLGVQEKALIISAAFLIDFIYYEGENSDF